MRDLETIKRENEKAMNDWLLKALAEGRVTYKKAGEVLKGWGYENNLPKNMDGEVLTTAKEEFAKDDKRVDWTTFYDLCGGGYHKTEFDVVAVEANEETAKEWFRERFGVDPDGRTCDCCGSDFSISFLPITTEREVRELYDYQNLLIVRKDEIGGAR